MLVVAGSALAVRASVEHEVADSRVPQSLRPPAAAAQLAQARRPKLVQPGVLPPAVAARRWLLLLAAVEAVAELVARAANTGTHTHAHLCTQAHKAYCRDLVHIAQGRSAGKEERIVIQADMHCAALLPWGWAVARVLVRAQAQPLRGRPEAAVRPRELPGSSGSDAAYPGTCGYRGQGAAHLATGQAKRAAGYTVRKERELPRARCAAAFLCVRVVCAEVTALRIRGALTARTAALPG